MDKKCAICKKYFPLNVIEDHIIEHIRGYKLEDDDKENPGSDKRIVCEICWDVLDLKLKDEHDQIHDNDLDELLTELKNAPGKENEIFSQTFVLKELKSRYLCRKYENEQVEAKETEGDAISIGYKPVDDLVQFIEGDKGKVEARESKKKKKVSTEKCGSGSRKGKCVVDMIEKSRKLEKTVIEKSGNEKMGLVSAETSSNYEQKVIDKSGTEDGGGAVVSNKMMELKEFCAAKDMSLCELVDMALGMAKAEAETEAATDAEYAKPTYKQVLEKAAFLSVSRNQTGWEGEKFAYHWYVERYGGVKSVKWENEEGDAGNSYDISMKDLEKNTWEYVEVKTTRRPSESDWGFYLTENEYKLAEKKGSSYIIARVTLSDDGNTLFEYRDPIGIMRSRNSVFGLALVFNKRRLFAW